MPSREQHALIAVQDVVFDNDAIKQAMTDSDYKNLMDNLMLVYRALQPPPEPQSPTPRSSQRPSAPPGTGWNTVHHQSRRLNMLLDVAELTSNQPTNNGPPLVEHDFTSDNASENESSILTQVRSASGYNNPRPSQSAPEPSHQLPSPPPLPPPPVAHSHFQPIPPRYRLGDTIPLYIRPEQSQIQSRCMMCKHCRKIKNWGQCSSITCSLRRDVCYRSLRSGRINGSEVDNLIGRYYTNYQCHYFRTFLTPQEISQLPEGGISGLEVLKIRMCKVRRQRRRLRWFQELSKHLQDNHQVDPIFLSQDL